MTKTIKLIELLNKIANKEEIPEKIKYDNVEYIKKTDSFHNVSYYVSAKNKYDLLLSEINSTTTLNEEVEIIEDEIDIDSIEEINYYDIISAVEGKTDENINNELAKHSLIINKLIQAVKQLDKANK